MEDDKKILEEDVINNDEVVEILEQAKSELTVADNGISREAFRVAYDIITSILENLNNVSSIVVHDE